MKKVTKDQIAKNLKKHTSKIGGDWYVCGVNMGWFDLDGKKITTKKKAIELFMKEVSYVKASQEPWDFNQDQALRFFCLGDERETVKVVN
jgi:hypothetical protein